MMSSSHWPIGTSEKHNRPKTFLELYLNFWKFTTSENISTKFKFWRVQIITKRFSRNQKKYRFSTATSKNVLTPLLERGDLVCEDFSALQLCCRHTNAITNSRNGDQNLAWPSAEPGESVREPGISLV